MNFPESRPRGTPPSKPKRGRRPVIASMGAIMPERQCARDGCRGRYRPYEKTEHPELCSECRHQRRRDRRKVKA